MFKEFNIRHYETHHEEKYDHLKGQIRKDEINKFVAGLKKQQSTFTRSRDIADGAVEINHLLTHSLPNMEIFFLLFVNNCVVLRKNPLSSMIIICRVGDM